MKIKHLAAFAVASCLAAWSQAGLADAWIESFSGDASGYRITREGASVPVAILGSLRPGDVVEVVANPGEIVIVYQTGESVELRGGDEAHSVRGSTEAPSAFQNLMRWSMETIKGWYEKDYEMTTAAGVNTRSTVSQITFPLFRGEGSWVGQRSFLEIPWSGGLPPYQVQLQRLDDIVAPQKFEVTATSLDLTGLAAGDYVLTVLCAVLGRARRPDPADAAGRSGRAPESAAGRRSDVARAARTGGLHAGGLPAAPCPGSGLSPGPGRNERITARPLAPGTVRRNRVTGARQF